MNLAWGGYSNGQIPYSALRQVSFPNGVSQYFEPDMAARVETLVRLAGQLGVRVNCQDGYRPMGIPSDQYVRDEHLTSTGGSNMWFQWGRMQRGETPSAANPATGGGSHGWGRAGDFTPGRENPVMLDLCNKLGLGFAVSSESWHAQVVGDASIPYTSSTQNEDDMRVIHNQTTGHIYTIGPGFLHHVVGQDEITQATEAFGPEMLKSQPYFDLNLRAYGIPLDKATAVLGGKTWIATGGTSTSATVDVAAIAKAVNDDAAKRMSN